MRLASEGLIDTDTAAERKMLELIRAQSYSERLKRVFDLNRTLEILSITEVRSRYPDASDWELRMRVASRRLSPEVMLKAFDWDVRKMGY
jgi:hypothetical protein